MNIEVTSMRSVLDTAYEGGRARVSPAFDIY